MKPKEKEKPNMDTPHTETPHVLLGNRFNDQKVKAQGFGDTVFQVLGDLVRNEQTYVILETEGQPPVIVRAKVCCVHQEPKPLV